MYLVANFEFESGESGVGINWWDIGVNEESGEGGGEKFPRLSSSPPPEKGTRR